MSWPQGCWEQTPYSDTSGIKPDAFSWPSGHFNSWTTYRATPVLCHMSVTVEGRASATFHQRFCFGWCLPASCALLQVSLDFLIKKAFSDANFIFNNFEDARLAQT